MGPSLRFDVLQVMAVETLIDLLQQLRGRVEIDLRRLNVHVPQVSSQPGQPRVDVLAVAVPRQQAMNGKRVPQIVNSRAGVPVMGNPALAQELPKGGMDGWVAQAAAAPVQEQRRVRLTRAIRCRFSTYWPKASLAVPLRDTQRALRNFPAAT